MPDEAVIRTVDLTKTYSGVTAVAGLNLEVRAGEVFGFLGPNGSGKTTTVKLILGLVRPTSGSIELFGTPADVARHEALGQIGAIVEAPAFYPYLSGRDNLRLLARMARIDAKAVDRALDRVGLAGAADRRFESYSVGMKQRLGIAAALLRRPRLVLLDEPTSGLDPAGQREIRALIPDLARDGCTVFLSSHMMHEVQEICDRVGIIQNGKLLSVAPVEDLVESQRIVEIRVADIGAAERVLTGVDWVTTVSRERDLLLVSAPTGRSEDLNRALAMAGIYAAEIRVRRRDLEDVFLTLTSGKAA